MSDAIRQIDGGVKFESVRKTNTTKCTRRTREEMHDVGSVCVHLRLFAFGANYQAGRQAGRPTDGPASNQASKQLTNHPPPSSKPSSKQASAKTARERWEMMINRSIMSDTGDFRHRKEDSSAGGSRLRCAAPSVLRANLSGQQLVGLPGWLDDGQAGRQAGRRLRPRGPRSAGFLAGLPAFLQGPFEAASRRWVDQSSIQPVGKEVRELGSFIIETTAPKAAAAAAAAAQCPNSDPIPSFQWAAAAAAAATTTTVASAAAAATAAPRVPPCPITTPEILQSILPLPALAKNPCSPFEALSLHPPPLAGVAMAAVAAATAAAPRLLLYFSLPFPWSRESPFLEFSPFTLDPQPSSNSRVVADLDRAD
jgi:hypothetical protein